MSHFDGLRLPPAFLAGRHDAGWEASEQSPVHRAAVLRALQEAVHDALVARALKTLETGDEGVDDAEFHDQFWTPLWDSLRSSLTRQDLLRWLMDWASTTQRERAVETVCRVRDELDCLGDEGLPPSWLTQNPG